MSHSGEAIGLRSNREGKTTEKRRKEAAELTPKKLRLKQGPGMEAEGLKG